ncbi:MAG: lipoprotein-releasing system transmembrane subunit LolC [Micavibrio sp.]|nr:lipoprotein-releasing system transmembrane subunit LolC [Micavibrio sp.]|tara:strand:- start:832 stop:2073 length:1242 start_codon:yes stop_codon:yes gene_type:complete
MFNPFERMVAWRYLRAKKAEGFVSVIAGFSFLGIMLGVATLIIVMSVMNGFRAELIGRILGLNGHISISAVQGDLPGYDAIRQEILKINGVVDVMPSIEKQALLSVNGAATGVMLRGISAADFAEKKELYEGIVTGDIANFNDTTIAVGSELAKSLNLAIGSQLTIISPQVKAGPFGAVPRSRSYTVGLVFDVGMYEYNRGFIFVPLDEAQKFFQMPNKVSLLEVTTPNPAHLDEIKRAIIKAMPPSIRISDWRDTNHSFYNALQVERNVMFLILTLIIIVAAFNIISSMIMLVKDKSKDIAIMRTVGAGRGSILKIFILTGSLIGFMGTFFGAGLGIAFALNIESVREFLEGLTGTELFSAEIYFLSQLPAVIEWSEVIGIVGMALFLSLAATLYPAWRASRLDPVEVLRYE